MTKETQNLPGVFLSARYWDGTRRRGQGLDHRTDLHKMNGIYGTGQSDREFPIYVKPGLNHAEHYEGAAEFAAMNQADLEAWLNLEKVQREIREWSAEDWAILSYHLRAAWMRRLDNYDRKFKGCMLYDASPDRDTWHTIQWNNTHAIRIPNLVCGTLYTGPHQAGNFLSLQRSRANGYDLALFVALRDQTTNPSQQCSFRAFSEQIKLCARLIEQEPGFDETGPNRVGQVSIVVWDAWPGHEARASDEDWDRALGYADRIVKIRLPNTSESEVK